MYLNRHSSFPYLCKFKHISLKHSAKIPSIPTWNPWTSHTLSYGQKWNYKDSLFKTMQKAGAAAHSESPGSGTLNLTPCIGGCRWVQRSHHALMCKTEMAEITELLLFLTVNGRGICLQCTETARLAVLPLLVFLGAGLTEHRAASCRGELAWDVKSMETLYNVLAKAFLITSSPHRYSNALWQRGKYICESSARTDCVSQVSCTSVHITPPAWESASTCRLFAANVHRGTKHGCSSWRCSPPSLLPFNRRVFQSLCI